MWIAPERGSFTRSTLRIGFSLVSRRRGPCPQARRLAVGIEPGGFSPGRRQAWRGAGWLAREFGLGKGAAQHTVIAGIEQVDPVDHADQLLAIGRPVGTSAPPATEAQRQITRA